MKYYFLPLKLSESRTPSNYGWRFVHENEGRLVESDVLIEVNTYDRGTTRILYDNVVYLIKKDFVDISNSRRIYVGIPANEGVEVVDDYDVFVEKMG